MNNDYGKIAYYKVLELENKLKNIEEKIKQTKYQNLTFSLPFLETKSVFSRRFSFDAIIDTIVNFSLYFKPSYTQNIEYEILLNGTIIKSGTFSNSENALEFDNLAISGLNTVIINLNGENSFFIKELNVTVSGNITYSNVHRRVSSLTLSDCNYILTINENQFEIYKYTSDGGLKSLYRRNGILDCHLSAIINDKLYVLYIDLEFNLYCFTYQPSVGGTFYDLGISGVTSVCGYKLDNGVRVYLSKANYVHVGTFIAGEKFEIEKTNRRGAKVTCEGDIQGVYLISDAYKFSKLITSSATFVVEKGENYHYKTYDIGFRVYYKNSNQVYYQDIQEYVNSPKVFKFCDEVIKLYDNKFLVRVRENLTII